jgi:hypothetical protein
LGPLLFLLFINDLPSFLTPAKVVLYADDTNILLIDDTYESLKLKVKNVIVQLELWFSANFLKINTNKTNVLLFHGRGPTPMNRPIITINNSKLIYSSNVKFLGIEISDNLSWTNQINQVCIKLNKVLYLFKSLRNAVSIQVLRRLYFAKFESILRYGLIFWGGCCTDLDTVFKVQKKCLRIIKGVNNRTSCRNLFVEFNILTATSLYILEILCFTIKNRINTTLNSDVHNYNTLHRNNLYVMQCNSNRSKTSVKNMGIKLFNNLPLDLKNVAVFKLFKRKLKKYLMQNAFYSLQEFFMK